MHYKASTITSNFPDKMAAKAPVAIGTRGTVGSLVRREIEYFTKLELDRCASSRKRQGQMVDVASASSSSSSSSSSTSSDHHARTSFWFLTMSWKRKKRRCSSSGFLPSICSAVEVADSSNQLNGIPGFSYRLLKDDVEEIDI